MLQIERNYSNYSILSQTCLTKNNNIFSGNNSAELIIKLPRSAMKGFSTTETRCGYTIDLPSQTKCDVYFSFNGTTFIKKTTLQGLTNSTAYISVSAELPVNSDFDIYYKFIFTSSNRDYTFTLNNFTMLGEYDLSKFVLIEDLKNYYNKSDVDTIIDSLDLIYRKLEDSISASHTYTKTDIDELRYLLAGSANALNESDILNGIQQILQRLDLTALTNEITNGLGEISKRFHFTVKKSEV